VTIDRGSLYKNSSLHQFENNHFENEEYLLGDGAYPISKSMIVPFRNAQKHPQTTFNLHHSRGRIAVERAFGRLKGRFQALKELRVKKAKHGTHIIDIALILHNFIEHDGDHWEDELEMHGNTDKIEETEMDHVTIAISI
jgi:hypothetical protein